VSSSFPCSSGFLSLFGILFFNLEWFLSFWVFLKVMFLNDFILFFMVMPSVFDVNVNDLIDRLSVELKGFDDVKPPEWAFVVKTGVHKERPPENSDWWYVRSAAVLRSVHSLGPVGVSKLRTKYGGKGNRGVGSERHVKGSGNIIRKILQQLESAGLVVKSKDKLRKGRETTGKGHSLLSKVAKEVGKGGKS